MCARFRDVTKDISWVSTWNSICIHTNLKIVWGVLLSLVRPYLKPKNLKKNILARNTTHNPSTSARSVLKCLRKKGIWRFTWEHTQESYHTHVNTVKNSSLQLGIRMIMSADITNRGKIPLCYFFRIYQCCFCNTAYYRKY